MPINKHSRVGLSNPIQETEQPADNVVAQLKWPCNNSRGDTSCLRGDGDKGTNAVQVRQGHSPLIFNNSKTESSGGVEGHAKLPPQIREEHNGSLIAGIKPCPLDSVFQTRVICGSSIQPDGVHAHRIVRHLTTFPPYAPPTSTNC